VVVEFGSLWAAPLCGGLLARAGCRVVKVESVHRPDGARRGPASFFASLNCAKEEVTVDPTTKVGLEQVRRLVDGADVVLEASRPRALAHWGLDAAAEVARGVVWASITGYGRTGPRSGGVAFGDDAAVSGGLVLDDPPGFVADAVADPVTGMLAAVAVRAALDDGVGALLDLSLAGTARWLAGPT
jgi:crotonobetainyl-CoA:carnitine CoA-transferase CaiB-like acyl-CoA transferase